MSLTRQVVDVLLLLCVISIGLHMPDIFEQYIRFYSDTDHLNNEDNYRLCLDMAGGFTIGILSILFTYSYSFKYALAKYFIAFSIYFYFKFYFITPITLVYYSGGNDHGVLLLFFLSSSMLISYRINISKKILLMALVLISFAIYCVNKHSENQKMPPWTQELPYKNKLKQHKEIKKIIGVPFSF